MEGNGAKTDKLFEMSKMIALYLQKNFHPNTTVVIECDRIRVEETYSERLIEFVEN